MTFVFVLLLGTNVLADEATPASSPTSAAASEADIKLHADSRKLVEVSGIPQKVADGFKSSLPSIKQKMIDRCPTCAPQFADEWAKRMTEQFKLSDYLDAYADTYAKYLSDAEITELTALQRDRQNGKPAAPSAALKSKLDSVLPSILAEIAGKCTQIGAKAGAVIGQQIEKEHPEYFPASADHAAPIPAPSH